ncbi:hypothetical protein [Cellulomonas sp. URHD0024]|nr:hypothetical protein [Cellulomonas sp. URHD0024]
MHILVDRDLRKRIPEPRFNFSCELGKPMTSANANLKGSRASL